MQKLDIIFIGAVMNYDGQSGSFANYIRQDGKWIAPFQYIHRQRPEVSADEAQACVYGVPSLGVCKLVDHLRRRLPDLRFHIFWHFDYHRDELLHLLQHDPPRLVAISTTLAFYPRFLNDAIDWINHRKRPETKVVIGGKWLYDQFKIRGLGPRLDQTLRDADPDYAIINAFGEETLCQLLLAERSCDRRRARALPSIACRARDAAPDAPDAAAVVRDEGALIAQDATPAAGTLGFAGEHYRFNPVVDENHTPGSPMIDFEHVGHRFLDKVVHVRTCSSCPFRCRFCTFPALQGEHVLFDLDAVMTQFRQLKSMGVTHLYIVDDTFNAPKSRFEELMDRMIRADLGFEWVSFYRAQFATDDNVRRMRDAGCRMVFCGFESGNDDILKLMGKHVTVRQYLDGLEHLHRHGIETLASYIVGYPGETRQTAMDTLRLVNDPRVSFSRGSLFYYDPNAPVSQIAAEWDLVGFGNDWSHKTMDSKQAARLHLDMIADTTSINTPVSDGGAWSIFNLYARGLSFDDIKNLYRQFNDIQKQQVAEAGAEALARYRSRATQARRRPRRKVPPAADPPEAPANDVPDV